MRNRGLCYDIFIHAHGIFQSHPPSVILSCPPHTLTDLSLTLVHFHDFLMIR